MSCHVMSSLYHIILTSNYSSIIQSTEAFPNERITYLHFPNVLLCSAMWPILLFLHSSPHFPSLAVTSYPFSSPPLSSLHLLFSSPPSLPSLQVPPVKRLKRLRTSTNHYLHWEMSSLLEPQSRYGTDRCILVLYLWWHLMSFKSTVLPLISCSNSFTHWLVFHLSVACAIPQLHTDVLTSRKSVSRL